MVVLANEKTLKKLQDLFFYETPFSFLAKLGSCQAQHLVATKKELFISRTEPSQSLG